MAAKTPSLMERSIDTIIHTFHKHSRKEGNRDTLNKKEFKDLVTKDLANFMKKEKRCDNLLTDIMEDLDTNQNEELTFEEFIMLIAKLVFATHESLHENNPRGHDHSHGEVPGK
ncbi:protein S100-A9 [Psammomys obesus]|uniref:protein S100-A9 n=1 Tax=Psammomys obesus TaxID=48139 RepID=UPI0024529FFA|nr:protein S100-A9 [Psammomys obesus]XP_055471613.1 protein S100-A9 [Psammomys obesus]